MKKHIMVVDDSKTIRNLVAFVLKGEGFKVSTAEDGLDAIEKLYSLDPVDLIVSDVNMPRMDGFTFIKTIRAQEAYKDIPIIVLSTEGQEKDIQTGMSLGHMLGVFVQSVKEDPGALSQTVITMSGGLPSKTSLPLLYKPSIAIPACCSVVRLRGSTWPLGKLPALTASKPSRAR